jgi:hypothetical protein
MEIPVNAGRLVSGESGGFALGRHPRELGEEDANALLARFAPKENETASLRTKLSRRCKHFKERP